jgi:predicted CopG family antitoxin
MGTKMVRLDDDTYEYIEAQKRPDESFSEAIQRLVEPPSLLELAGILSDEGANEMREAVEESREADIERRRRMFEDGGEE